MMSSAFGSNKNSVRSAARASGGGAPGTSTPLMSPTGRNWRTTGCCTRVLTNRVTTTCTSSTSPFRKRSRASAAIARDSGNRGVSPYGKSATSCRRVRATNWAALRPAVMKTVEWGSYCPTSRNRLLLSAPHRPLSDATRMIARFRTGRTSSSGCLKSTRRLDFRHPLLEVRPVRKRAIILVASDKGLCGALNSNLFRLVGQYDPHSTVFITAGRKAAQFVARPRRQLVADFPYGDTPRFPESRAIAALARDLFLKGEVDEVQVVVTRFVNTLVQQPVVLQFLPVGDIRGVEVPGAPPPEALAADRTEFLIEPNADDIIGYLLGHYLNIFIHLVLLNAKASEQSA